MTSETTKSTFWLVVVTNTVSDALMVIANSQNPRQVQKKQTDHPQQYLLQVYIHVYVCVIICKQMRRENKNGPWRKSERRSW